MTRAVTAGLLVFVLAKAVSGQAPAPGDTLPPAAASEFDTLFTSPPLDTGYVIYREPAISLPLGIGLRAPSYNRVDGLVLPWGPLISLFADRFRVDPTVTYRSHIGAFDPYARITLEVSPATRLELEGGRSTFTNDAWIRSELVNTAAALWIGSDARNYFRADRATIELSRHMPEDGWTWTPSVGALLENAWSTGSPLAGASAPWSFLQRTDTLKMRRPNPAVAPGHITSAFARLRSSYARAEVSLSLDMFGERAFDAPAYQQTGPSSVPRSSTDRSSEFTQITVSSSAHFPTIRTHYFQFRGRLLLTPGSDAPPQRFGYLGGAGTLATVDLLALGGDRLFYAQGEYLIPFPAFELPLLGPPELSLRYAAGAAGAGELPDLVQNIGLGIGVRFAKLEYHVDPDFSPAPYKRRNSFSFGLSLRF